MGRVSNSSGRWDAVGNIHDAVLEQETKACGWALGLGTTELSLALEAMVDPNAFSLYERKYLLLAAAGKLRAINGV